MYSNQTELPALLSHFEDAKIQLFCKLASIFSKKINILYFIKNQLFIIKY